MSIRIVVDTREMDRIIAKANGKAQRVVHDGVEYGRFVEFGTEAHIIEPRVKKALYWEGAEHPVKRVHHPGTSPRPWLTPAAEGERAPFLRALGKVRDWDQADALVDLIAQRVARQARRNLRDNGSIDTGQLVNSVMVSKPFEVKL